MINALIACPVKDAHQNPARCRSSLLTCTIRRMRPWTRYGAGLGGVNSFIHTNGLDPKKEDVFGSFFG